MDALYSEAGPGDDITYPESEYEKLSLYLATEFRDKLRAAEKALADALPPMPWTSLGEALSQDGYIQMKIGLRRLGSRP